MKSLTHNLSPSMASIFLSLSPTHSLTLYFFLSFSYLSSPHLTTPLPASLLIFYCILLYSLLYSLVLFSSHLVSPLYLRLSWVFRNAIDSWDMKVRSRVSGTGSAWRYAGRGSFPSLPFSVCGLPQHRLSSGLPPVHPYSLLMFTVAKDPETVSDSY